MGDSPDGPRAERDDQDEAECRSARGDRAKQDQQRARRRDQAAGQPEDEEAPPRDARSGVRMRVVVRVPVLVRQRRAGRREPAVRARLGADVHEDEALEQVQDEEADHHERHRRASTLLDRLGERVERPEFTRFYRALETFLRERVDPVAIDETGEYPDEVVDGLRTLGAFGMKIPTEYGGLGFTVSEYTRTMQMVGAYDGNLAALLSAHQSIGVPQPLKLFGTPEQKAQHLPKILSTDV